MSDNASVLTEYETNEYPLIEENVEIPNHARTEDKVEKAFKESRIEDAFAAGSHKRKSLALVRVLTT